MNLRITEAALIRQHNLPENFAFFSWEVVQRENPSLTRLTGGICEEKRKTKPYLVILHARDWKKRNRDLDRTYYVTDEQAAQFEREYVERTGNCPNCQGARVELASCGVLKAPPIRDDGEGSYSTYRTCSKCKGTGKSF